MLGASGRWKNVRNILPESINLNLWWLLVEFISKNVQTTSLQDQRPFPLHIPDSIWCKTILKIVTEVETDVQGVDELTLINVQVSMQCI